MCATESEFDSCCCCCPPTVRCRCVVFFVVFWLCALSMDEWRKRSRVCVRMRFWDGALFWDSTVYLLHLIAAAVGSHVAYIYIMCALHPAIRFELCRSTSSLCDTSWGQGYDCQSSRSGMGTDRVGLVRDGGLLICYDFNFFYSVILAICVWGAFWWMRGYGTEDQYFEGLILTSLFFLNK